METKIFHPGNSALLFQYKETTILVDGIYNGINVGMSKMPISYWDSLYNRSDAFSGVNALIFTHLHPDHYSEEHIDAYLNNTNNGSSVKVYGPGCKYNDVDISYKPHNIRVYQIGDIKIVSKLTLHDGDIYRQDIHESVLIICGDESFFIAGDAELFHEDAAIFLAYTNHINYVFCNLYQFNNIHCIQCITSFNPDKYYLYHLPDKIDDTYNYRSISKQILNKLKINYDIDVITLPHMSWCN